MTVTPAARRLVSLALAGLAALGVSSALRSAPVLAKGGCGDGGGCCGNGEPAEGDPDAAKDAGAAPSAPAAKSGGAADAAADAARVVIDLGNTKCPVMGGKPDGRTWSEWNGLRVGHCCPGCVAKFAAAPEKSLDAAKIAWRDAAAALRRVADAKPDERASALKDLEAKWKVVRSAAAPAAGASKDVPRPAADGALLVDLANTKCPVMGGKPDGRTWSEWNGLRVGHCCPMCTAKFAKDPERQLDAAKVEWRAAAAAVQKVREAKSAEERAKALAALKAKWTLLREPPAPPPPAPAPPAK